MKKVIGLVLAMVLCIGCSVTAFAHTDTPTPYFTNVSVGRYTLSFSDGEAEISADVTVRSANAGGVKAVLKEKEAGSSTWTDVETFAVKKSASWVDLYETCTVTEGSQYKVTFTFYAYNDNTVLESVSKTTSVQTA